MKLRQYGVAVLVLAAGMAGCASNGVVAPGAMLSGVMTDSYSYRTLYTFDKDSTSPTRSNCNRECAIRWPPYRPATGDSAAGDWTIFDRDDGSPQWAYQGRPVYFFAFDQKIGDKNGDGVGVGSVWRVVR